MNLLGHCKFIGKKFRTIDLCGFVFSAEKWIQVQARHRLLGWHTVGWSQAEKNRISCYGKNWYPWNLAITLPSSSWNPLPGGLNSVTLRAKRLDTAKVLLTVEQSTEEWFDLASNLTENWYPNESRNEIVLYAFD